MDGTFSDETGYYPAGTYIMNLPGSSHAPFSESGCTLFAKLRHLGPDQVVREIIDTKTAPWYQGMVDGVFEDEHGRYPAGLWIRSPHMSMHKPFSKEGCSIFVKTGQLMD